MVEVYRCGNPRRVRISLQVRRLTFLRRSSQLRIKALENSGLFFRASYSSLFLVYSQVIDLLRELITAKSIHSKYMDTKAAHNTAQRFNTEVREARHVDTSKCNAAKELALHETLYLQPTSSVIFI